MYYKYYDCTNKYTAILIQQKWGNNMAILHGILPALVTPFTADGRLDEKALERLVTANLQSGVDGFYVNGSTGESMLLSAAERMAALEVVAGTARGKAAVVANIGTFSTAEGIALARHAEKQGVTAVSSVPPFYFKFTAQEYYQYYLDIMDAVDVPVFIYNVPAMSGVSFTEAEFDRYFAHERIAGVKYTSYDLFLFQRLAARHPGKTMVIGHDEIYLSALAVGASALVGSTVGLMPEQYRAIHTHWQNGQPDKALQVQGRVNAVIDVLLKIGVFKGVKAGLAMRGLPCGACRKPFQPLSAEDEALLAAALRALEAPPA